MARDGKRQALCASGHDDWVWDYRKDSRRTERHCRTCRNDRRRLLRQSKTPPTRIGPDPTYRMYDAGDAEWDTYTYTELMKARELS